ncbi:VWA domain-containing protein [Klebsiella aerogenes]|uniref:VWA domain-containing protein n=1 Tax=Klebsiella aerogenes TaxID=548 RepID=UPI001F29E567|nr:VWA domain-containing protein [Klebsiella aerogenes]
MSELLSRLDFAWPWAWLLLLLPLLSRYFLPQEKPQNEHVRVPFLPDLIDELKPDSQPVRDSWLRASLFWLVWGLLVCVLARPEYLTPPQHIQKSMRDMVLILDVSGSMAKNDVPGGITRLQAVQTSVRRFIAARQSDRIGMVIFASSAWPFAPVSEDKQALKMRIRQLVPGMIGQQTAIGDALGVAVKMLDESQNKEASKLAILLTDGNDTTSQLSPALAARLAAAHDVQVHTIAFGDLQSKGDDKVDLSLLKTIASTTGGKSWTAANSGAALDSVWSEIDAITPVQVKTIGWSWHLPLFVWPMGLVMLILLVLAVGRLIAEKRR